MVKADHALNARDHASVNLSPFVQLAAAEFFIVGQWRFSAAVLPLIGRTRGRLPESSREMGMSELGRVFRLRGPGPMPLENYTTDALADAIGHDDRPIKWAFAVATRP